MSTNHVLPRRQCHVLLIFSPPLYRKTSVTQSLTREGRERDPPSLSPKKFQWQARSSSWSAFSSSSSSSLFRCLNLLLLPPLPQTALLFTKKAAPPQSYNPLNASHPCLVVVSDVVVTRSPTASWPLSKDGEGIRRIAHSALSESRSLSSVRYRFFFPNNSALFWSTGCN